MIRKCNKRIRNAMLSKSTSLGIISDGKEKYALNVLLQGGVHYGEGCY